MYDAGDNEVTDMAKSVKNVYTIKMIKLLSGVSHTKVLVAKTTT